MKRWYKSFRTRVGKLKIKYAFRDPTTYRLTANQQFLYDNGKWLWNTYKHVGKTLYKIDQMEVSSFVF